MANGGSGIKGKFNERLTNIRMGKLRKKKLVMEDSDVIYKNFLKVIAAIPLMVYDNVSHFDTDESINKEIKETKKDDITVDFTINSGGEKEFPVFEANDELGTSLQKMIIVLLRDTIRWKNYRFFPGRQVDILWTKDEYVLFDIIKTEETIEFKPRAVYKNTDVGMINALDVDLSKIDCSELVWKKDEYKASDVNRAIKKLEKNSFERKSFVVEG